MEVRYKSTRSSGISVTASEAILKGLAEDGGLYVPERIPKLEKTMAELAGKSYQETAYEVMKLFFTDYTEAELKECIKKAYDEKFDTKEIAPVREAGGYRYLELFHGPTIAFKDMALAILPHLLTTAAKKQNLTEKIVILTATSGDTGKAALAGFAGVGGTEIIVFYPKDGVSRIQERQMVTQEGENTFVAAIKGNFDDAQSGVKEIFENRELAARMKENGYRFSSANSINIGRLIPQVVYYVYTYASLLAMGTIAEGEPIHVAVPTGNFGNILAAYYAKQMGVPICKLICASNENKVLYDFFCTGIYDRNREFILTSSPSMDILVSSNLERLIYACGGEDAKANACRMEALKKSGRYEITPKMRQKLSDFVGGYAREEETKRAIRTVYEKSGYVIDTHTAVATAVYEKYKKETNDGTKTVIVSTASPYKFGQSVLEAIVGTSLKEEDDFALADRLFELSGVPVPKAVEELRNAPVRHGTVCEKDEMQATIEHVLDFSKNS